MSFSLGSALIYSLVEAGLPARDDQCIAAIFQPASVRRNTTSSARESSPQLRLPYLNRRIVPGGFGSMRPRMQLTGMRILSFGRYLDLDKSGNCIVRTRSGSQLYATKQLCVQRNHNRAEGHENCTHCWIEHDSPMRKNTGSEWDGSDVIA